MSKHEAGEAIPDGPGDGYEAGEAIPDGPGDGYEAVTQVPSRGYHRGWGTPCAEH